jgi:hypothetical protein
MVVMPDGRARRPIREVLRLNARLAAPASIGRVLALHRNFHKFLLPL